MNTSPSALAEHYRYFRVADRLLMTGHSHQAWPDVALAGIQEAFADAAEDVDRKWAKAFVRADRVRAGFAGLLGEEGAELALGANTHELLVRFGSALDLVGRPRVVTTDGEFHSARRQLARLAETDIDVVTVPSQPVATLAERLAAQVEGHTAAVLVSSVLFETAHVVPHLAAVAQACARHGAELLVDAYHHLGVVPFSLAEGLSQAWVVGGGYKYLQLGEGNCFLRLPAHAQTLRPIITGWYAEFGDLDQPAGGGVAYARGADRFAGATYDPTSHYRASRVLDFFVENGLSPARLREISLHQRGLLAAEFDHLDLPDAVITRDRLTSPEGFGGFLSLTTTHASRLQSALAERGVSTDARGDHLRLGPAPYLTDDQLRAAVVALDETVRGIAEPAIPASANRP
ncbi:MAG: hypothetical protein L0H31_15605 [Nocardioidaceae bacterium]|nr:hypothetical protein [Nocardioidaceae bacterium]